MKAIEKIRKEIENMPAKNTVYVIESRVKMGGKKEKLTYRELTQSESYAFGKVRIENGYVCTMLELIVR